MLAWRRGPFKFRVAKLFFDSNSSFNFLFYPEVITVVGNYFGVKCLKILSLFCEDFFSLVRADVGGLCGGVCVLCVCVCVCFVCVCVCILCVCVCVCWCICVGM